MRAGRIVDGRVLARERRLYVAAAVAEAVARDPAFPVPTLGLVAAEHHPDTRGFVELKDRAFRDAGLAVRARVLPRGADTAAVLTALAELAGDAAVHGVFLQYPLPDAVDGRACFDAIPLHKDVDGSSRLARLALERGEELFAPATPRAVLELLEASGARLADTGVTVVTGDGGVDEAVVLLLRRRGVGVRAVAWNAPGLEEAVSRAAVLVVSAGRPGAVRGPWLGDGGVVVDAGYHHPGGRGDVHPEPDPARLRAWVPARGGVGPLTVALLAEHTFEAARRSREGTRPS